MSEPITAEKPQAVPLSPEQPNNHNAQRLKEAGISVTMPRLELLQVMQQTGKAMTAHEIYREHLERGLGAQLSSIYVNLKRLEQCRIVSRIRLGSESRSLYCLASNTSACRLVCQRCGQLHYVQQPHAPQWVDVLAQTHGFIAHTFTLIIEGECSACTVPITKRRKKS